MAELDRQTTTPFVYPEEDEAKFREMRRLYAAIHSSDDYGDDVIEMENELDELKKEMMIKYGKVGRLSSGENAIVPDEIEGSPTAIVDRLYFPAGCKSETLAISANVRFIDDIRLTDKKGMKQIIVDPRNPVYRASPKGDLLIDIDNDAIVTGTPECDPIPGMMALESKLRLRLLKHEAKSVGLQAEIDEDLNEDFLRFDKVMFVAEFFDNKDYDGKLICLERDGGCHLRLLVKNSGYWNAGQGREDIDEIALPQDEEHLALFALLCEEVAAMSSVQSSGDMDPDDAYDTIYRVRAYSEDRYVDAKYASTRLFAILERFLDVEDSWYRFPMTESVAFPGFVDLDIKKGPKEDRIKKTPFRFECSSVETRIAFSVYEHGKMEGAAFLVDDQEIEIMVKEGLHTEIKTKILRSDFSGDDLNFVAVLQGYCDVSEEEEGFLSLSDGNREIRVASVPKSLLDLMNYLSPEKFSIPEDCVEDHQDSRFVAFWPGETVPDEAFKGNRFIERVKIYSDVEGIGKEAFRDSSLRRVVLSPRFYAYRGTGELPKYVGENAFLGADELYRFVLNGIVYVGTTPDDYGHRLPIRRAEGKDEIDACLQLGGVYATSGDFLFRRTGKGRYYGSREFWTLVRYSGNDEEVKIPTRLGEKSRVIGIEENALTQSRKMKRLVIDNPLLVTGPNVFGSYCDALEQIVIDRDMVLIVEPDPVPDDVPGLNAEKPEPVEEVDESKEIDLPDDDLPF